MFTINNIDTSTTTKELNIIYEKQIIRMIKQCIPDYIMEWGTSIVVRQVACQAPGCVPLETIIWIIFPKQLLQQSSFLTSNSNNNNILIKEFVHKLKVKNTSRRDSSNRSSSVGENDDIDDNDYDDSDYDGCGTYQTKIYKPMSDIQQNDVYDALPSSPFIGGKYHKENVYYRIRDTMFGALIQQNQQPQLVFNNNKKNTNNDNINDNDTKNNNDIKYNKDNENDNNDNDIESKILVAQYLQQCLQDYIDRKCIPPELGKPYPDDQQQQQVEEAENQDIQQDTTKTSMIALPAVTASLSSSSPSDQLSLFMSRQEKQNDDYNNNNSSDSNHTTSNDKKIMSTTKIPKIGNIVIRRPLDIDNDINSNYYASSLSRNNSNENQQHRSYPSLGVISNRKEQQHVEEKDARGERHHTDNGGTTEKQQPTATIITTTTTSVQQQQVTSRLASSSSSSSYYRGASSSSYHTNNTNNSQMLLSRLMAQSERQGAPGIRRPSCPCCDPDNPSHIVDQMMMM